MAQDIDGLGAPGKAKDLQNSKWINAKYQARQSVFKAQEENMKTIITDADAKI